MGSDVVPLATAAKQITRLLRANAVNDEEIAKRLRTVKDDIGEKRWLAWCGKHWGWKRRQAYNRLQSRPLSALANRTVRERPMRVRALVQESCTKSLSGSKTRLTPPTHASGRCARCRSY